MSAKRTHDQFIREMDLIAPEIEIVGQYISVNTKIECHCKSCGCTWSTIPKLLLKGHGCKSCSFKKMGEARRKSNEQFVTELHSVNEKITPLEEYINNSTALKCKCDLCGYVWEVAPSKLLSGSGCPSCKGGIRKTNQKFFEEVKQLGIQIVPMEEYVNAYTKIRFKCEKCNYEWSTAPTNVINKKHGCPNCSKKSFSEKKKKTTAEFIKEMAVINPRIEIIDEYTNNNTKLKCKCLRCEQTWFSLPTNLRKGRGCPTCSHTSTSFVEQTIRISFARVFGEDGVVSRDLCTIGMELDIYIPALGLAIEPGNWFWHKDKISRDTKKRLLCNEKGIRLITIFDCFNGDPNMFSSDFYHTDVSLNEKKNYHILKEILYGIFEENGLSIKFSESEWKEITNEAIERSKKKKSEDFKREIEKINPKIEVLGEYKNSSTGIECICKKCGWRWFPTPNKLTQGRGCPQCAGRMRKTHEQFLEEVCNVNPNVEVLGKYVNAKSKIEVRCVTCGANWFVAPSSLLKGHGCAKCRAKTTARKVREFRARRNNLAEKFPEVLADWNSEKNGDIALASISSGSTQKYHWKCHICGYEYISSPGNRTRHGCPQCARKRTNSANMRAVINLDTKEVFSSLNAAGEKYGGTGKGISNACAGRVKTAYGYRWAYYDNNGPRKRAKM